MKRLGRFMAEGAARVVSPRLRAAWLREMGVEVLWPVGARPLRPPLPQHEPQDGEASDTDASPGSLASPAAVGTALQPQAARDDVPSGLDDAVSRAEGRFEAPPAENLAMLACRLYASEASSGGARWMIVSDAAELHASREGPARFLDALIHAVMPEVKASSISIPIANEDAVGWLAGDVAFAPHVTEGLRLILIGAAARRAAGMATRLGEIGRLQAGSMSLPAVALPLLNDLTASPTGKADAWRVLRALDSAGS